MEEDREEQEHADVRVDDDDEPDDVDAYSVLDNYDYGFLKRSRVTSISELTADR